MKPEVSYLIVCFDSENYIIKCINSILNQSHKNYEIIIIDNNSQDNTISIIKDLSMKNEKIKIITNPKNIGYGNAIANALKDSNGEFLAILNADVILDEQWTSNLLKIFRSDENIMLASGKILFPNDELQSTGGMMDKYGAVLQRESKIFYTRKVKDTSYFFYTDGSSFMVRRNIFDEISFDPNLFMYYEDVDLSWKIRMLGYKIGHAPEAVSYHDMGHSDSDMSVSKFYYIIRNRIYVCQKNYSLKNVICRIPGALCLIFLNAIFYDIKKTPKGYTGAFLKALAWNLSNLGYTLKEQKRLRTINKISDSELDNYIIPNSIELSIIKMNY